MPAATATKTDDLLTRVRAKAEKGQADAEVTYRALVARCAAERDTPEPEEILQVLADISRDLDQFQSDVEARVKRLEMAATFAGLAIHQSELAAARSKIAAAESKYSTAVTAAQRAFDDAVKPLLADEARLTSAINAAERAGGELVGSCPYAELLARRDEASQKIAAARDMLIAAEKQLRPAQDRADRAWRAVRVPRKTWIETAGYWARWSRVAWHKRRPTKRRPAATSTPRPPG